MKATLEERTKEVPGGYIKIQRRVKFVNGIKKATRWEILYDSRRGY